AGWLFLPVSPVDAASTADVAAAIALAACDGGAGDAEVDLSAPKKVERTVEAAPGKPAPPIDLRYSVLGEPEVGSPLEITLDVGTALVGPVTLSLRPKDGLVLGANQPPSMDLAAAAAAPAPGDAAETRRITVIPQAEGRSYLVVNVTVQTDAGPQTKVMSIPVQVGALPPRMQSNGTVTDGGADAVVSMPAAER
ncbi:MAG: hypothetical protein AAFX58_10560, partial [Pseudomonadota bacterium]